MAQRIFVSTIAAPETWPTSNLVYCRINMKMVNDRAVFSIYWFWQNWKHMFKLCVFFSPHSFLLYLTKYKWEQVQASNWRIPIYIPVYTWLSYFPGCLIREQNEIPELGCEEVPGHSWALSRDALGDLGTPPDFGGLQEGLGGCWSQFLRLWRGENTEILQNAPVWQLHHLCLLLMRDHPLPSFLLINVKSLIGAKHTWAVRSTGWF